jgi:hypothetical protein
LYLKWLVDMDYATRSNLSYSLLEETPTVIALNNCTLA